MYTFRSLYYLSTVVKIPIILVYFHDGYYLYWQTIENELFTADKWRIADCLVRKTNIKPNIWGVSIYKGRKTDLFNLFWKYKCILMLVVTWQSLRITFVLMFHDKSGVKLLVNKGIWTENWLTKNNILPAFKC
jgi:hypothetical protein